MNHHIEEVEKKSSIQDKKADKKTLLLGHMPDAADTEMKENPEGTH